MHRNKSIEISENQNSRNSNYWIQSFFLDKIHDGNKYRQFRLSMLLLILPILSSPWRNQFLFQQFANRISNGIASNRQCQLHYHGKNPSCTRCVLISTDSFTLNSSLILQHYLHPGEKNSFVRNFHTESPIDSLLILKVSAASAW